MGDGRRWGRERERLRTCTRTGCRWPAAASLSYRYGSAQVWLVDLSEEPDPSLYDLCPHHAETLVVPRGWERVDQRTVTPPRVEPSAAEIVAAREAERDAERSGTDERAEHSSREPVNRYAELCASLPRLAAEIGGAMHPAQRGRDEGARAGKRAAMPVPSRDLAPLPRDLSFAPPPAHPVPGSSDDNSTDSCAQAETDEVPGQLVIPLDETQPGAAAPATSRADDEATGGVVVPFELNGARRRPLASQEPVNP